MSFVSFTKFGLRWENVCVIQCGNLFDGVGGLKGSSQICSEAGAEPK